jgi:hypothetical protein
MSTLETMRAISPIAISVAALMAFFSLPRADRNYESVTSTETATIAEPADAHEGTAAPSNVTGVVHLGELTVRAARVEVADLGAMTVSATRLPNVWVADAASRSAQTL